MVQEEEPCPVGNDIPSCRSVLLLLNFSKEIPENIKRNLGAPSHGGI